MDQINLSILHIGDLRHVGYNIVSSINKNGYTARILVSTNIEDYKNEKFVIKNPFHRFRPFKYLYILYHLITNNYDILHAHSMAAVFPFLMGKKYIMHCHGTDLREFSYQKGFFPLLFRKLIRSADHVIATTYDLKKDYNTLGFDKRKFSCIPNSVLSNIPIKKTGSNYRAIRLFSPSSNHWTKEKNKLLKAYALLKKKYPFLTLDLLDDGRYQAEEIKGIVKTMGLDGIHFITPASHEVLLKSYQKYDIVLDQFGENPIIGLITYEAMMCAIPAICTLGGNFRGELDDKSPILPGYSPNAIYESVQYLIDNKKIEEHGQKSRDWAMGNVSEDAIASIYEALYKQVIH